MIVYDGPSMIDGQPILGIMTLRSDNRKTGDMAQLWILRKDMHPSEASKKGCDVSICGDCPLRQCKGGACYVVIFHAPTQIWNSWKRGKYKEFDPASLVGKHLRLGAYGDPAALPFEVIEKLTSIAKRHVGYTHSWDTCDQRLKSLCMASTVGRKESIKANKKGWRTFRVVRDYDDKDEHERVCLAESKGLQCQDCMLCRGGKGPNLVIKVHGKMAKRLVC